MGNKIRELRESDGISITMLAHKTEVSSKTIAAIEKGDANPTMGTLQKIADYFECKVVDLIDVDGK